MTETTTQFWDCECQHDYIHPAEQSNCTQCGIDRNEGPDSHVEEVLLSKDYKITWMICNCCSDEQPIKSLIGEACLYCSEGIYTY